jgi:hypothetical protein
MCDMMQTLTLYDPEFNSGFVHDILTDGHYRLKQIVKSEQPGADEPSIEDRLKTRMGAIIGTIKYCAKVCDTYQKRRTMGA